MTAGAGLRKRVYKEARAAAVEGGFEVQLDGRTLRTPAGGRLVLPAEALATAIATEWQAQGDKINPETMPMMSLACTALDRVVGQRDQIVEEILRFAETDLLCHRADTPAELARRQSETWQPLMDWAAQELEAPLQATTGILAVVQPPESLAALRRTVEGLDDLALTALSVAVSAAGSLVIGLALLRGRLDPEAAFEAAELDTSYQIELWGEDPEATRRRAVCRADLDAAARLVALL
ncbi:MAG: ATP12 family protein [Kiloniellales bacterium]|nr:ATP12 family protein [Kiloniellales bacterium]